MSDRLAFTTEKQTARRAETRDAVRVLELLVVAEGCGVMIADLRERGVQAPGQAIYELELAGRQINRRFAPSSDGRHIMRYRLAVSVQRSTIRDVSPNAASR